MKYLLLALLAMGCTRPPHIIKTETTVTKILACGTDRCRVILTDKAGNKIEAVIYLPYVGMKYIYRSGRKK